MGAALLPPVPITIRRGALVVGRSFLEYPLPTPGAIVGRLVPGPGYDGVRAVFRLYRDAVARKSREGLRRFVAERDALSLAVEDREGERVDASVDLISEWSSGPVVHLTLR